MYKKIFYTWILFNNKYNIYKVMPQLDIASFFSQIFWLLLVFILFYVVVQKNILPFISRVLKLRHKKLFVSKLIVNTYSQEQEEVNLRYNTFFSVTCNKLETLLHREKLSIDTWLSSSFTLLDFNKKHSDLVVQVVMFNLKLKKKVGAVIKSF